MQIDVFLITGALLAVLTSIALAWKWQLGVVRVGGILVVLAAVCGLAVALMERVFALSGGWRILLVWLLTMTVAASILIYAFFRDPERTPPDGNNLIVSPADGVVAYVRRSSDGVLPVSTKHGHDQPLVELTRTPLRSKEAVVIGIAMSFTDVHVNRSPIKGRVTLQRHFPGSFGSLRNPEMVFRNERATTLIERGRLQVAMVQIASRLVRQIVVYVSPGQFVALGQRIGMIRFGSQVDLVIPFTEDLKITVQPGKRVRAGESIVAMIGHSDSIAGASDHGAFQAATFARGTK
jgi:phosphatidylserine decarboxylase